jgi:hypothetical protein
MFIVVSFMAASQRRYSRPTAARRSRSVDGFTQSFVRDRHDRDGAHALGIERAKKTEQIGGGLGEVAACRQIHHCGSGVNSRNCSEAEREQCLAGLDPISMKPDACARRVMGGQHARRQRLPAVAVGIDRRLQQRPAEHAFDLGAGQAAGPEQHWLVEAADNGRFDADRDRTAVDNQVDPSRKVAFDMGGRGRRDVTRQISRRGCHRAAEQAQDIAGDGVGRYPDRDGVEAGGGEIGDRAAVSLGQYQRQWTRPERFGQGHRGVVKAGDQLGGRDIPDMGDQRIEGRPALGLVEAGDRGRIGGIGAEAVNGLGRERDQPAFVEGTRRCRRGSLAGGQNGGLQADIHCDLFPQIGALRWPKPKAISRVLSRSVAQPGRALRSGRRGRRFESCHSDHSPSDLVLIAGDTRVNHHLDAENPQLFAIPRSLIAFERRPGVRTRLTDRYAQECDGIGADG